MEGQNKELKWAEVRGTDARLGEAGRNNERTVGMKKCASCELGRQRGEAKGGSRSRKHSHHMTAEMQASHLNTGQSQKEE